MKILAERLKELRQEKNLKQSAVAKMLAVDQRTISSWERNVREPDFEMLVRIAKLFDVSVNYLLGLED